VIIWMLVYYWSVYSSRVQSSRVQFHLSLENFMSTYYKICKRSEAFIASWTLLQPVTPVGPSRLCGTRVLHWEKLNIMSTVSSLCNICDSDVGGSVVIFCHTYSLKKHIVTSYLIVMIVYLCCTEMSLQFCCLMQFCFECFHFFMTVLS